MGQKAKYSLRADVFRFVSESGLKSDIARRSRHVSEVPQPDSSARQVRTFRDLFLITEVLDSPRPRATMSALKRSWLGYPVRSIGLSGLLKSSKEPPLIHQTEAR